MRKSPPRLLRALPGCLFLLAWLAAGLPGWGMNFTPYQPTPREVAVTTQALARVDRILTTPAGMQDKAYWELCQVSSLIFLGRLTQARELCARIRAEFPGELDAYVLPLICDEYDGSFEAKLQALRTAGSPETLPVEQVFQLGLMEMLTTDTVAAAARFKQVTRARPDFAPGWYALAVNQDDSGNLEEGDAAFQQAIRLLPNEADLYGAQGAYYFYSDRLALAQKSLEQALRLRPHFPSAAYYLAKVLEEQGNPAWRHRMGVALLYLVQENQYLPYQGGQEILGGWILRELERLDDSRRSLEQAQRNGDRRERAGAAIQMAFTGEFPGNDPNRVIAWLDANVNSGVYAAPSLAAKGHLLAGSGDPGGGQKCLKEALSTCRGEQESHIRLALATLLSREGKLAEAQTTIAPCLKLNRFSYSAPMVDGMFLHRLGQYGQAQEQFSRAAALFEENILGRSARPTPGDFPPADFSPGLSFRYVSIPGAALTTLLALGALAIFLGSVGVTPQADNLQATRVTFRKEWTTAAIILLILAALAAFQTWRAYSVIKIGEPGIVITRGERIILAVPWEEVLALYQLPVNPNPSKSPLGFIDPSQWLSSRDLGRRPLYYLVTSRGSTRFSTEFPGLARLAAEIQAQADLGRNSQISWLRGFGH